MVAQLLRLKLALFAGGFRRRRPLVLRSALGVAIAVLLIVLGFSEAASLQSGSIDEQRRIVIVTGSALSLAAFLVPLLMSRAELLDPRALRGFGFRPSAVGATLLLLSLVGPLALLIPVVLIPTALWSGDATGTALLAAPLLLLQGMLSVRLGVACGVLLAPRPRLRGRIIGASVVLLLVALLLTVAAWFERLVLLLPAAQQSGLAPFTTAITAVDAGGLLDVLAISPLGALWAAPAAVAAGTPLDSARELWIGVALVVVLFAFWQMSVRFASRGSRRLSAERRGGAPGWFRRFPHTPTGSVAARSFIYWARDPRYRAVWGFLPLIPLVVLGSLAIAGASTTWTVLIPLPLMVVLVSWGTVHNDVAYDSTAVWTELVAETRGIDDRMGRLIPPLVYGLVLIVIGAPLTAWLHGSWDVLPAVVGVCVALLLGGLGVSSAFSARYPYPAPHPGDPAWQAPAVAGGGANAQAWSFLLILAVAGPALLAATLSLIPVLSGPWTWIALVVGIQAGLVALVVGVRVGSAAFEKRGPDLLAFTMRN